MSPCTCNTEMGDTCVKCAPKPAPVVLTLDGDAFLWPSGRKAIWPIRHGAAWMARADYTDILPPVSEHPTAESAAKARGVLLPPRVGDRWGDLTPEQRAMVPVGSELGATRSGAYLLDTDYWITKRADGWHHPSPNFPRPSQDSNVAAARRITRLGPAPTATPEPDRSGWPVLVKDGGEYWWESGDAAVTNCQDGTWGAWPDRSTVRLGWFPSALDAAEALGARLPDEVPEQKQAPNPALWDANVPVDFGPLVPSSDPRDVSAAEIITLAREATELRETIEKQGEEIARLSAALQRAKAANPAREHALALLDLAAAGNPALVHIAALLRL